MKDLKYSEILKINSIMGRNIKSERYNISVLTNITINQIKEIFEFILRKENINPKINFGEYDNIVQDSFKHNDSNLVIIFWEISNLIDGLQYKIELFDDKKVSDLLEKVKSEIDLVYKNLQNTSLVLFNKFSSLAFNNSNTKKNNLDLFTDNLNQYIEEKKQENVRLIDVDKLIAHIGIEKSIDFRYYYSSKALYAIDFFKSYTQRVKPFIMSSNGKAKKALILDCDNTLWKGILGEDGIENIEMSPKTKSGEIFHEIQNIVISLNKQGILIGLCSKNNSVDVDEVINSHPEMLIKDKHITIKKINWSDKAANLKEMAKELNIGLDSFVFVDDSDFEVNLVKTKLPEVTVLKVPEKLHEYPKILRENLGLFFNLSTTKEDKEKIKMYKQQLEREKNKKEFHNIEDYLASLDLNLNIYQDNENLIPRMAQMSQKTNQFNLTTKRYTEEDIKKFLVDENFVVYAISVSDKYGDNGVTGLSILKIDKNKAIIDTFLMSCRIIGRNIEFVFIDYIIDKLSTNNIKYISAKYTRTKKNEQVKEFYENCSFQLIKSDDKSKEYNLIIDNYKFKKLKYINLKNGK